MDVVRERRRMAPKGLYAIAGAIALVALLVWAVSSLSRGGSTSTVVDTSTLVTDTAQRGTLLRAVSAQGAFAPERVRVASATQAGVINQIGVKPGSVVEVGSVLAQMQNPTLEAAVTTARSQLQVAQADLASAKQQAQAAQLTQQSAYADATAQMQQDALQAESLESLHGKGLVSDIAYRQAEIKARTSVNDLRTSRAQVGVAAADGNAKVAAAQAQVDQAAAQLQAAASEVDALTVRAASGGIVQSVDVDPGMVVSQGAEIARIADTHFLKAVLQVAEGDVHAVIPGMRTRIDTGNGIITGRVSHIAPAAQNGTVAVDVSFAGTLPPGARPDANVDGTVEIAAIPNAVSIARPAGSSDSQSLDLFKVVDGGKRAVRVRVRLGQGSADRVQVLSGLAPGDVVIVSDMSNYLDKPQLTLH